MVKAIIMMAIIVGGMVLMMTDKFPMVVCLPAMGIALAMVAGMPFLGGDGNTVAGTVIQSGAINLADSYASCFFAAWLGIIMAKTKVTETMVKKGAELGGDKTLAVTIILYVITSLLFTTLRGLGSVIMLGSIVLPILMAVGVDKRHAVTIYEFGYITGNTANLSVMNTYSTIAGVELSDLSKFEFLLAGLAFAACISYICYHYFHKGKKLAFSAPVEVKAAEDTGYECKGFRGVMAMLTPLVPVVLVVVFKFSLISSFLVALVWIVVWTFKGGWTKTVGMVIKSSYDGLVDAQASIVQMIVLGILTASVSTVEVKDALMPLAQYLVPKNPVMLILLFGIGAPLGLYRGLWNLWGLGAGMMALMVAMDIVSPWVLLAGFCSTTMFTLICCPTQAGVIWSSGYCGTDVMDHCKRCGCFLWPAAILGTIIGAFLYF